MAFLVSGVVADAWNQLNWSEADTLECLDLRLEGDTYQIMMSLLRFSL